MNSEVDECRELVRRHFEYKGRKVSTVFAESISSRQGASVFSCVACFDDDRSSKESRTIVKFHEGDCLTIAFEAMASLNESLNRTDPLAVPTPFLHAPDQRAVVQQFAPGEACTVLFKTEAAKDIALRIGRALACLHCQRNIPGDKKTVMDHVHDLIRPHPLELAVAFPEFAVLIETAMEKLHKLEWTEPIPCVPLHRDYQLRQMFFDRKQLWVVDWDTFALGDAAFDVAYFIAYLRTHYDEREALETAFLDGYCETQGDATLVRIPVYMAFNFLRRACRRYRLRDRQWEAEIRRMFNLLAESLQQW